MEWLTLGGQSQERNESELICTVGVFLSQSYGRYVRWNERTTESACGSRDVNVR